MIEWMKIQDENGDTYLINVGDVTCISKDGVEFRSGRRFFVPLNVDDVERVIVESRKTGERWLNGKID